MNSETGSSRYDEQPGTTNGSCGATGRPAAPEISVVIVVRNRWDELGECLVRFGMQTGAPAFEVVIIDDGSTVPVPREILNWEGGPPVRYVRQMALGIAGARNRGLEEAAGGVVLYVDSDCLVSSHCLAALAAASRKHPSDVAFQLSLIGSHHHLVGCVEDLKLRAIIEQKLREDGHIEFANTSGFAIRKSHAHTMGDLFEVGATRGEDTLVLTRLLAVGHAPRFVKDAEVTHQPRLTLIKYLIKQYSVGYHVSAVRMQIRQQRVVLMSGGGKLGMLRRMCRMAGTNARLWVGVCLSLMTKAIEDVGRGAYRVFGSRPKPAMVGGLVIERLQPSQIKWRVMSAARAGRELTALCIPCSLLREKGRAEGLETALGRFDIHGLFANEPRQSEAEGNIGSDFLFELCAECERRRLPVGFERRRAEDLEILRRQLTKRVPSLQGWFFAAEGHVNRDSTGKELSRSEQGPKLVFAEIDPLDSAAEQIQGLRVRHPGSAIVGVPGSLWSQWTSLI